MFITDRLISAIRNSQVTPVVEAELLPSGVTKLVYKKPSDFVFKSGSWARIAIPEISGEYHPFTLTAAPHEKHLSMHIRAVGPWTRAIRQVFDPKKLKDGPMPFLYIDGPYGEGNQDWAIFETAILVGGGIGVTPFASILKDVIFQIQYNHTLAVKKVYFFWVCRNQRGFEWLIDIIRDLEEKDNKGVLEVHIFITELLHKFDLRTTMLYICEHQFQKISHRSIFTGLAASTHFGRPNFMDLFQQLQASHPPTAKIGVFTCGPMPVIKNVEEACDTCNEFEGARFYPHYENF